jgi:GDPmannose 4,6-dehydratase
MMLQSDHPDDFVVATGETHSVRDAVEVAFSRAGLDPERHVEIDPNYLRPTEVDALKGDASKAERELGWKPKTGFRELIELMVDSDIEAVERVGSGESP